MGITKPATSYFYQLLSDLFTTLLPPIREVEIVECVRKYMDRVSQNLQSLSSH